MDELADALFDPADEDVRIGTYTPPDGGPARDVPVILREATVRQDVMGEAFTVRLVQAMAPLREMQDARGEGNLLVDGRRYLVSSVLTDGAVAVFLDLQGPLDP